MPDTEKAIRDFRATFLATLARNLREAFCEFETSETLPNACDARECGRKATGVNDDGHLRCKRHL